VPDPLPGRLPYNGAMTSTNPRFSVAGSFLEALADRDFARLGSTLAAGVHVRGLLPGGPREWHGPREVRDQFAAWFGAAEEYELVDAIIGEVGPRLHLRWRLRVVRRPGDGWSVVEQQAYADTDDHDRIERLSLLCSGFCPEARPHLSKDAS
jgi:hypothetical protein